MVVSFSKNGILNGICVSNNINGMQNVPDKLLVRKWTFVQPQIMGWIHYGGFVMPNFNSIFGYAEAFLVIAKIWKAS